MAALFDLEIHTPYRLFYSGKAEAIIVGLVDGEIAVYANHSLFTAPVIESILRIKDTDGNWRMAFVSRGILEVKKKKYVLVIDSAEWPEEINRERALEAKHQAEKAMKDSNFKFENEKTKEKLYRAELRLKVLDLCSAEK